MSVKEILEIPNPILRQKAKKVRNIDKDILKIAYNMVDTVRDAGGVGLAANQIGELWRIIVLQMPEEDIARIYFNPEIISVHGTREVEEGCLSIPGYLGLVERSISIKFTGIDHNEVRVKFTADDLLSQALEHEVDHLNGILYTDHLLEHQSLYTVESVAQIDNSNNDLDEDIISSIEIK
ncbi:MAG: peptide deformylase [SAR202 cluster bacterium]|nr:peptide deformylase [SAR202 cluster bacterium]